VEVQILRELQARFSYVLNSRRLADCSFWFAEWDGKRRKPQGRQRAPRPEIQISCQRRGPEGKIRSRALR
jgi:hypothetical protein